MDTVDVDGRSHVHAIETDKGPLACLPFDMEMFAVVANASYRVGSAYLALRDGGVKRAHARVVHQEARVVEQATGEGALACRAVESAGARAAESRKSQRKHIGCFLSQQLTRQTVVVRHHVVATGERVAGGLA
eukprot:CAMPEP_0174733204 /NCGR_PEP_ID=MMETSP1094-20130205/60854_1 /TAXON_ID=156173 /ORGANISM="Chrysochromulina brevifilum, Strain UTEX LB 985" /LENGTH=132 /DNA_ID=CAMNT_0015935829 /DNA_START=289 /DNA_END=687 /DNA_ORIENTATION=-